MVKDDEESIKDGMAEVNSSFDRREPAKVDIVFDFVHRKTA